MTRSAPPLVYSDFGELLITLRTAAGFAKQQELATALGVTQQTVSRWEKGIARPRLKDMPELEKVVRAQDGELVRAAKYREGPKEVPSETATSYDRPLPLSALPPDTFESFCAAFLGRRYRERKGEVQRYGATGHKQHGIDIAVKGEFGTHTFQCKRVTEFGAQKVHTAVAEQTYSADLKVLLLSSVASPKARDAMAAHKNWELWDKEDITRKFHELPMTDRLDLVDRYFSGQRLDLLGILDAGPIQTPDVFFKPFLVPDRFFNHAWELIGRDAEVSQVVDYVIDGGVVLTCLLGAPGAGKSRILREISRRLVDTSNFHVRFVSPTEEVKAHHLEGLRDSNGGTTILVVDDAHEREDLSVLLRYAAVPENKTRLLLALRPYGKEALRLQAADVSLSGSLVGFVEMHPPTRAQAKTLAESILSECKGPLEAAEEIAKATFTTPLVTVLAAQLVARDAVSLELLGKAEEFRTYVLKSLQDVIAVKLVTGQDVERMRAVLRVIALLQPIIPDDPSLLNMLSKVEGVEQPEASRLMRLLSEAGVLFKRGVRSRLAPDLLADEIIRSNYLHPDGTANDRVTQVFEFAVADQLKSLFVNLGRLDWRLREGKTDDSPLLNTLGPKLRWQGRHHNPHVDAVAAVAYYQPRFALNFAKRLISDGHGDSASVCNMVRYAGYTYDHVQEACQLLWQAGRNDARELGQHPGHGIRVLKELATFQLNKPVEYVQEVVRFALALLERPPSLTSVYTPFSILEGALVTEIEATSYSRMTMTFSRYQLSLDAVRSVRDEVTEALLKYLREGPDRKAFIAAQTLSQALRGPMHGDTAENSWKREHLKLLQDIKRVLHDVYVAPPVLVRIGQAVAWHAFYGHSETAADASEILALINRDLRTRLVRALIDGWGTETWRLRESEQREEHEGERELLTAGLIEKFSDPGSLLIELNHCLESIENIAGKGYGASYILVNHLLDFAPGLATELLLKNKEEKAGQLALYVGKALSIVIENGDSQLLNEYLNRSEGSDEVMAQLAEAYARFSSSRAYTESEIELFRRIFRSSSSRVLFSVAGLARQIAVRNPTLAVELICLTDFSVNLRATHEIFMWLAGGDVIPKSIVAQRRSELLEKLIVLDELEDYWVRGFLTAAIKEDPAAVIALVKARLLEAARREGWSYTPLSKEHGGKGLGLMEIETGPSLLAELLDWALRESEIEKIVRRLGEVVAGLCGNYDRLVLDVLLAWLSSGTKEHAALVARILRESQSTLLYQHSQFIKDILNAAELIGDEALDDIRSSLVAATRSGVRSGTPGQPFPQDVQLEQHCIEKLAAISRVEPTFEFYDELLKDARYSIAQERRSRFAVEDDDD
ncbi:XRE family transcriptional regulator [Herbaspirillum hiltneri N3]|uniref:XRE family transcriptional regulator n=1 Tax=Herbaspirillum hiltneri N3 TaxID=1262470 RepID=A0ABN4I130_9BURK|nr:helix-turn-helix domain-containing protein [Herbaspirillum hiltneri]AKZ64654.1 XRE family transcriptional regulator [Herbaspirillum hiltneri N3]